MKYLLILLCFCFLACESKQYNNEPSLEEKNKTIGYPSYYGLYKVYDGSTYYSYSGQKFDERSLAGSIINLQQSEWYVSHGNCFGKMYLDCYGEDYNTYYMKCTTDTIGLDNNIGYYTIYTDGKIEFLNPTTIRMLIYDKIYIEKDDISYNFIIDIKHAVYVKR